MGVCVQLTSSPFAMAKDPFWPQVRKVCDGAAPLTCRSVQCRVLWDDGVIYPASVHPEDGSDAVVDPLHMGEVHGQGLGLG